MTDHLFLDGGISFLLVKIEDDRVVLSTGKQLSR